MSLIERRSLLKAASVDEQRSVRIKALSIILVRTWRGWSELNGTI